ncbi:hypothetical protein Emed_002982 [Eimeria media]
MVNSEMYTQRPLVQGEPGKNSDAQEDLGGANNQHECQTDSNAEASSCAVGTLLRGTSSERLPLMKNEFQRLGGQLNLQQAQPAVGDDRMEENSRASAALSRPPQQIARSEADEVSNESLTFKYLLPSLLLIARGLRNQVELIRRDAWWVILLPQLSYVELPSSLRPLKQLTFMMKVLSDGR